MEKINKEKVVFYLNPRDKNLLFEQAESLQIKASILVRNLVLQQIGKPVIKMHSTDLNTKEYLSGISSIGNNLNQIARKLNSDIKLRIIDEERLEDQIEELKEHIIEIIEKLQS